MAYYVNLDGLTRQQAEQQLYELMSEYHQETLPDDIRESYEIQQIWLPIRGGQSKVELIYPGKFQLDEYDDVRVEDVDKLIEDLQKYKERMNG